MVQVECGHFFQFIHSFGSRELRIAFECHRFGWTYFFAMRSADTHMDFDLDLAVSQSNENPVYYAQYAHARICSILRQAEEQGLASHTYPFSPIPIPRTSWSSVEAMAVSSVKY